MMRTPALSFLASIWTVLAATASAQVTPTFQDVVIGDAPLDAGGTVPVRMNIYLPPNSSSAAPVLLWIHGGGWQSGDHNQLPGVALPLLDLGIAIATIDYRLSQEAIFPAQIEDVKGAVRYLRANAASLGVHPERIACWGSSAGGHLAALLGSSGSVSALEGNTGGNLSFSSRVVAAVDYFGPTDIVQMNLDVTNPPGSGIDHDAADSPESRLIGYDNPGEGIGVLRANLNNPSPPFPALVALADALNPITHIDALDPAQFVAHGTADTSVPLQQSVRLVNALQAQGVAVIWRPSTGAGHGALGATIDAEARAFVALHLLDCNANGIVDSEDLANGTASDVNGNGVLDACESGSTGTALCFGDGTGNACPCNNLGAPGHGCANSAVPAGALISATGVSQVGADSLQLMLAGMPNPTTCIFIQGSTALNGGLGFVNGDGLICVAGAVIRLAVRSVPGNATYPQAGDLPVSVRGMVPLTGAIRYYQGYYRNNAAFCSGATFNFTNALRITWTP